MVQCFAFLSFLPPLASFGLVTPTPVGIRVLGVETPPKNLMAQGRKATKQNTLLLDAFVILQLLICLLCTSISAIVTCFVI